MKPCNVCKTLCDSVYCSIECADKDGYFNDENEITDLQDGNV